jgi:cytochrome c-type biogenesis protein CcmH/NrfG
MGRALPLVVAVVLAIYCLVQVAQSRADLVRTLPRWAWALVILLIPVLGPVAWLVVGRPHGPRPAPPQRQARPLAPDDDPDFLRRLRENRPQENPDDH